MNIFSFTAHFDSEEACRTHFKKERDEIGVVCKECGHRQHYWIKSRWSYECKNCRSRTSLRSGTIMQTRFAFLLIILTSISIYFGNAQSPGSSLFPKITDWKLSEPGIWGPHNLYTPINGAADMFLSYNFEEMQAADYSTDSNYISVEVYRHKTPIDAFGAYSQERPDRDIYSDIGVQAYSEDTYIHLLANRYYIKIRTANSDDKSRPAMGCITHLSIAFWFRSPKVSRLSSCSFHHILPPPPHWVFMAIIPTPSFAAFSIDLIVRGSSA